MACVDQRRLTGSGSALEVVLHDYALYKSAFTLLLLLTASWLYITDNGNFRVAHALYHVTLSPGVQNNHSYEIFDPYLPIHYATFMRLR